MECQYGKSDIFSFDLYKSCPQLKAQFAQYRKVFEQSSLVFAFCIIPVNEEQPTNWMLNFIAKLQGTPAS
jgi:hypothetical protein